MAGTEYLGRIQSESDDGVLYVDTGFGSQMTVPRLNSRFLKELKKTPVGARAADIIYSYLYLIDGCDPQIPGCDADEDVRRLKALRIALATKPKRKNPTPHPPSGDHRSGESGVGQ